MGKGAVWLSGVASVLIAVTLVLIPTAANAASCTHRAGIDYQGHAAWSMPLKSGCTSYARHRYDPPWSGNNYWSAYRYNSIVGYSAYTTPAAVALYFESGTL